MQSTIPSVLRRPLGAVLLGFAAVSMLAGCGSGKRGTLYMLFDASESSSALVREGYKDDAVLAALSYCHSHPGSDIVLNVITATPEQDSIFETLRCPNGANATDQQAQEIVFRAQLASRIEDVIQIQAQSPGSDVIGAINYAAEQTFRRFPNGDRVLVIFSDMQQSGGGVRNCIKGAAYQKATSCLTRYYVKNPDIDRSPRLKAVDTYVVGFAKTIRGSVDPNERRNYEVFWRSYFARQGARLCWFAASDLPVLTNADGSKTIDPRYFNANCAPA